MEVTITKEHIDILARTRPIIEPISGIDKPLILDTTKLSSIDFPTMYTDYTYYFTELNVVQNPPIQYKLSKVGDSVRLNAAVFLPHGKKVAIHEEIAPVAIGLALYSAIETDTSISEQSYVRILMSKINSALLKKMIYDLCAIPLDVNCGYMSVLTCDDEIIGASDTSVFSCGIADNRSQGKQVDDLKISLFDCIGTYNTVAREDKDIRVYIVDRTYDTLYCIHCNEITTNTDGSVIIHKHEPDTRIKDKKTLAADANEIMKMMILKDKLVSAKGNFNSIFIKSTAEEKQDEDFFSKMF